MTEVEHRLAQARGRQRRVLRATVAIAVFIALIGAGRRRNRALRGRARTCPDQRRPGRGGDGGRHRNRRRPRRGVERQGPGPAGTTDAAGPCAGVRGRDRWPSNARPAHAQASTWCCVSSRPCCAPRPIPIIPTPDGLSTVRPPAPGLPAGCWRFPRATTSWRPGIPGFVPVSRALRAERGSIHSGDAAARSRAGSHRESRRSRSGAEVTHNGRSAGTTPLNLAVLGGAHTLRVAYPGHQARTETLAITHDAPDAKRHFRLEPAPGPEYRSRCRRQAERSPSTAAKWPGIWSSPPGRDLPHPLREAGLRSAGDRADPEAGRPRRVVAITLYPVHGVVSVRSEPETDVEVDGRHVGRTPKRLRLQAVPQTIRLSRNGYRAETRTVTPDPDTVQQVVGNAPHRGRGAARHRAGRSSPTARASSSGSSRTPVRSPWGRLAESPAGVPTSSSREVRLVRAFYAGVHEVTAGQFRQFTHPGELPSADRRPVTGIGWEDAARFCNWLSEREGLVPVYRFENGRHAGSSVAADGYRLPTEAEWEWLARKAGRDHETRFPWGDATRVPERSGNLADESARGRVPVYIPRYDDGFAGLAENRPVRGQCRGAPRSRRQRERVGARRLRRAAPGRRATWRPTRWTPPPGAGTRSRGRAGAPAP